MENNWFDVEIVTTSKKKWNLAIITIFPLLLILSIVFISSKYYFLFLIWIVVAGLFLLYDYMHSNSIVEQATRLLFKDNSFSIITEYEHFKLELKKEDVTCVQFDRKNYHIAIIQKDKVLFEFTVKPKIFDDLYDTFNSFGYNCETKSFI